MKRTKLKRKSKPPIVKIQNEIYKDKDVILSKGEKLIRVIISYDK